MTCTPVCATRLMAVYLIFFIERDGEVQIVRVLHGSRG